MAAPFVVGLLLSAAGCVARASSSQKLTNSETSLTLLYQNNLNASDDINHIAAILLDDFKYSEAAPACAVVNEKPLSRNAIKSHYEDFYYELSYLAYSGQSSSRQSYIIHDGLVTFDKGSHSLEFSSKPHDNARLPVLCTQSANASQPTGSNATTQNEITVPAAGNTYTGYRNLKSWRFSGIPFADVPERWHYSKVYSGTGQAIDATQFGSECPQVGGGSENCLFLNIQTPYVPKVGSKKLLKPVYFWIYGIAVCVLL